jgi:rhamnosyltransferase subunit B
MTQFLITALGSYGDVHPMVGLGSALVARGHRAKIVTNPYFEDVVTGAGLELVPLGTRENYIELSQHPDLWHPIRGPKLVLSHASGQMLEPLYNLLVANYVPGETVFCPHVMDMASRVAAEQFAAPIASILFAPGVIWSLHDSPRLKGALLGPRVPRWLKHAQFWAADRWFMQPLLAPHINGLRKKLGQLPLKGIFNNWLFETDLMLGLFPDWFGPRQPDWPPNSRTVGFPLWDAHDDVSLAKEVVEFLDGGAPPIVFSPGSANREAHQFFAVAVDTCVRLGRRGILLTKYDHQLPSNLPETVRHFGFVPMSKLLPHTCALVHHGGIGSCAQALAAGVPQIVRPMSYDQFDNSRRLERLGVSKEISVRKFTSDSVAESLSQLLESTQVAAKCKELAARCDGRAALTAACEALERLANQRAAR